MIFIVGLLRINAQLNFSPGLFDGLCNLYIPFNLLLRTLTSHSFGRSRRGLEAKSSGAHDSDRRETSRTHEDTLGLLARLKHNSWDLTQL